jgi:hypothetical protein
VLLLYILLGVEIRKTLRREKTLLTWYFSHENNGIPGARPLFPAVNSLKTSKVLCLHCKSTKGTSLLLFASHEDQH